MIPRPPQINASSYILIDAATGTVLTEYNADSALPPASLTKIMTTYVADNEIAAGNISLNDEVFVSVKAWQAEGSKMFIQEGTKVRLEDIMRGVIIQSGNDSAIALAEHIAGSEEAFADMMNQHAQLLGMTSSHFTNASGLPDPVHVMSSRDLATLARAVKIITGTASARCRSACSTDRPSRPGRFKSNNTNLNRWPACSWASADSPSGAKATCKPSWRKAVPSQSESSGVSSTNKTGALGVITESN